MIITELPRLLLRHFHTTDADAIQHVFGDPEVMYYGDGTKDSHWVDNWIRGCLDDYAKLGFGLWAVVEKGGRQVIGYCGLSYFPDLGGRPETEIGYRLARRFWGRGYATEAASAVRDYGFGTLNLSRLVAMIDPRNSASLNVARKLGMIFEKEVTFQGFQDHLYVIHRRDDA